MIFKGDRLPSKGQLVEVVLADNSVIRVRPVLLTEEAIHRELATFPGACAVYFCYDDAANERGERLSNHCWDL